MFKFCFIILFLYCDLYPMRASSNDTPRNQQSLSQKNSFQTKYFKPAEDKLLSDINACDSTNRSGWSTRRNTQIDYLRRLRQESPKRKSEARFTSLPACFITTKKASGRIRLRHMAGWRNDLEAATGAEQAIRTCIQARGSRHQISRRRFAAHKH